MPRTSAVRARRMLTSTPPTLRPGADGAWTDERRERPGADGAWTDERRERPGAGGAWTDECRERSDRSEEGRRRREGPGPARAERAHQAEPRFASPRMCSCRAVSSAAGSAAMATGYA